MKIFISADIEGVAGCTTWDETEKDKGAYQSFAKQMTREVEAREFDTLILKKSL